MFIFARFYKGSHSATCRVRIVVLPMVLHGFGNPRYQPWFSTGEYHALGDMLIPCSLTTSGNAQCPSNDNYLKIQALRASFWNINDSNEREIISGLI